MAALPRNKKLPNTTLPPRSHEPREGKKGDLKGDKHNPPGGRDNKDNKGNGGIPRFFGGLGGYKGVDTREVKRLVNGVLRQELNDLRKQRRQVRRASRNEEQRAKAFYNRGKGDLQHVFGETQDYLGHLQTQNNQMFADQQSQSQAAQQALQAQLGNTYSGAQSGAQDELARLGITGGGNFSQLMSDQANQQAMAAQSGANAQNTMNMAQGNANQLSGLLSGMNQGSFMSHMGQNLNTRNDALSQVRQNRMDQYNAINEAMSDAKGSRRDLFFQLLQQLQQTGWNQYLENPRRKRR